MSKRLQRTKKKLDVKGINLTGNIYNIKVVAGGDVFYGVKAISPSGQMYDVKGIDQDDNVTVNGVKVKAHVKALPQ